MKQLFLFLISFSFLCTTVTAQQKKTIQIIHTDFTDSNQNEIPGASILTGNVQVEHDGVLINCNKLYFFKDQNYAKAFGNVVMNQGDTIYMNSRYAEYNGNEKFAYASGDVSLRSPESTLTTDTLNFDRNTQQAFYNSYGTIINKENTLKSKSGRYYLNEKKYQFLTAVTVTNPQCVIKSNHLDFFDNSGHAYVFGPSTITSKENVIYTERGFYDTKKDIATLTKNSTIKYNNRLIKGDKIFYDRKREFSSATDNVKITDTINKMIIKGHYAEVYKNQDSMFITKRAIASSFVENDSVYIHAKKLMITGKQGERIIRGFSNARIYKTDMSGKCDSIHSNQKKGLTQMIGRPVLWNNENQMTGDVIHLIGNNQTEKLDSLKVLNNAFIVQKDTLGTGYNQVKGQDLFGKFKDNKLSTVDLIKNTEKIYYMYNDKNELEMIDKGVSSKIHLELEDNKIVSMTSIVNPESESYPPDLFPENARKLRGFVWRGDERIKSKEEIFPPEENLIDEKIQKQSAAKDLENETPMEARKETLEYGKPVKKENAKTTKKTKK
ncbi:MULTISPECIES: OstA-like protein [unclassified Flavobacterium]|uniref:OstA-like protein n=1 Tax=unclassified Flavobacterium TaxID=196869 RepID=UPI00086ED194|nr:MULTISPECIES: OstA-like protein [unclassified Flavobacterium]MBN9283105.1 OstA-like protein [Flavobacterium sp.]ODS86611.1 MAG: OstA-like protein [Chryseobacterium sp. SCN 40-13]OJV67735.1 MAG: OstA-like protein [Flavobacterium sp. 40-81]